MKSNKKNIDIKDMKYIIYKSCTFVTPNVSICCKHYNVLLTKYFLYLYCTAKLSLVSHKANF